MKRILLAFIGLTMATLTFAQYDDDHTSDVDVLTDNADIATQKPGPKAAVTLGVLNGGGGIVGADMEFLISDRVGFQVGAGLVSYGCGINYHLSPGISSSMINVGLWHQGAGDSHTQTVFGPSYVYRAKKFFTSQIGLGFLLKEGPAWPDDKAHTPVMLLYSIGFYLPI